MSAPSQQYYEYPVEILHLLVSPEHAYFGRPREGAVHVPTTDADEVEIVEGRGIVGDRFYGKAAHMDAAVTLFAVESLEAIAGDLGAAPFDPLLTRRNLIVRGLDLNALIGHDFVLRSQPVSEGSIAEVQLRAGRPANPCAWMDRMYQAGVHAAMRGRGGVRCMPLGSGRLRRGPAVVVSPVELDPARAGSPMVRRRLP